MSINTSVCIYPDGTTNGLQVNPQFVPCNPLAAHSACCAIGESCIGNGLCYSDNGGIYRGACTDPTWKAEACARYCVDADGDQAGDQAAFNFLVQCYQSDDSTKPWSCINDNTCTDGNMFTFEPGGIQQLNISGLASVAKKEFAVISSAWALPGAASSGTSPTTTSRSSASAAPASYSGNTSDESLIVGVGVGIPLGVLLLAALAGLFWYRHKWIKERDARAEPIRDLPQKNLQPSPPSAWVPAASNVYTEPAYKRIATPELNANWLPAEMR